MSSDYRQAQLLVELAAMAAYHGEAFARSSVAASRSGIESYWLASRTRFEAWAAELKQLEQRAELIAQSFGRRAAGVKLFNRLMPLAEEVLSSEVLTRVWAAIGGAVDRRHETYELSPFVRSVFFSHLESRNRLLRLAFNKVELTADGIGQLERLRRRVERWNDVLIGYLVSFAETEEFAFDHDRVLDFSTSLRDHDYHHDLTRSLLMVSLRSTFKTGLYGHCPNPKLNGRICEAVMACYGADIFDSIGIFRSLWQIRLSHVADDTQGMIDSLAAEHGLPPNR